MVYHKGKEKASLFFLYVGIIWIFAGGFLIARGMGAMIFFFGTVLICEIKKTSDMVMFLCITVFFTGLSLAVSLDPEFFQSKLILVLEALSIVAIAVHIIRVWHRRKKLQNVAVIAESFLVGLVIQKFTNACGFFEHYPKSIHESTIYFLVGATIAMNQVVFLMLTRKCINFVELKINVSKKTFRYFIWSFIPATIIMFIHGVRLG